LQVKGFLIAWPAGLEHNAIPLLSSPGGFSGKHAGRTNRIKCGQNSLGVFCLGIVLAFCARAAIETSLNSRLVQIFVGTIGILFLTANAYYWS